MNVTMGAISPSDLQSLAQTYFAAFNEVMETLKLKWERARAAYITQQKAAPFAEETFTLAEAAEKAERLFTAMRVRDFSQLTDDERDLLANLLNTAGPAKQQYFLDVTLDEIRHPKSGTPSQNSTETPAGKLPVGLIAAGIAAYFVLK